MKERLLERTGSALFWRGLQLISIKLFFFVRLLILARLLTPEDFGLLAIAVSTVGVFMNLTNIGMIPALVQRRDVVEKDYNTAWTIGLIRALGVSILVIAGAPLIAKLFGEPRATPIIQVLALRPVFDSLVSIRIADLNRNIQFRPLVTLKLAEALTNTIVSISLANSIGVWALVAGTLAGAIVHLILSYVLAPHKPQLSFDRYSAHSLIHFGRWIFVNSIIVVIGATVFRVAISRQLGAAGLGLYYLAAQLAFLPSEIATEVVGSVSFPLFSRLQSDIKQLTRVFKTSVIGMAVFLYPVSVLIITLAPTFIQKILGPKWEGTENVIRILSLVVMIGLFGEAVVPVLKGVGQPYRVTIIELVQSSILILFIWELTGRLGVTGAALAWLPAVIASQFVGAYYIRKILYKPIQVLIRPMLAITISALVGGVFAFWINQMLPSLLGLVIAVLGALIMIIAIMWQAERSFSMGLVEDLNLIYPKIAARLGFHTKTSGS